MVFYEKIETRNRDRSQIFKKYLEIHNSVAKSSKACKVYLIYLIVMFGLTASSGTYNAIVSVVDYFKNPKSVINSAVFVVLGEIEFLSQTILLLLVPLVMLGKICDDQKKVTLKLLKLNGDEADDHGIAHDIDLLQRVESIGYNVFGGPITRWKTITWLFIGPFVKVLLSKYLA